MNAARAAMQSARRAVLLSPLGDRVKSGRREVGVGVVVRLLCLVGAGQDSPPGAQGAAR